MSAVADPTQTLYKSTEVTSKYRPEIDGLRALAVVAVIINHFNKDLLPSGYLGVDIFFVISGYVITSSLAGRESKNFLDFLTGFYERRIKRLVPALVVFVLITSVLISLFNSDPSVALGLGWRSLFGISNINLFRASTDYFAQSAELNPFTHTWSLGVEEQFYLLFPFLIWFSGFGQQTAKGARNLFFWVGTLTIVSLIGFIYLYQVNQPAAYFLMPPRFWEMAAGCLLFIGFQKRARIEKSLEQVPPLLVVAAMVGVMYLPVAAAVPATIGIVVLSAVLIACLKHGTAAYKFFTLETAVHVGLISYSLYLWHWTVLSISRWTIGIHWWSVPLQAGLMLLIAAGSHKWIETPLRQAKWAQRKQLSILFGASYLMGALIALKALARVNPNNLFQGSLAAEKEENQQPIAKGTGASVKKCSWWMGKGPSLADARKNCTINRNTADASNVKRFYILGDSHAGNMMGWVESISQRKDIFVQILYVHGQSAPPIKFQYSLSEESARRSDENKQNELIEETLHSLRNGDTVILSNYLIGGLMRRRKFAGRSDLPINDPDVREDWLLKFEKILSRSKAVGANIVIVLPLPDFKVERAEPDLRLCVKQWYRTALNEDCLLKTSRKAISNEIKPVSQLISSGGQGYAKLYIYDPFKLFCGNESAYCTNYKNGKRVYLDGHHLNVVGARLLAPDFNHFLKTNRLMSASE